MSANLIVGKDPTGNKVPVAVDAAGKLQIGGVQLDALNLNTDQIESKQDTTNAILTTTAADLAAVKNQLATGTVTVSGGGGGGGTSAQYNSTLPTYTSGATTSLQTDVNGRLITTGGLTDTQLRASAVPVSASTLPLPSGAATSANQTTSNTSLATIATNTGNIPALVSGRVPVDGSAVTQPVSLASVPSHPVTNAGTFAVQPSAGDLTSGNAKAQIVNGSNTLAIDSLGAATVNNADSVTYTYSGSGVIAANTVLIGPVNCAKLREFVVAISALGTSGTIIPELSNDNTNWYSSTFSQGATIYSASTNATGLFSIQTNGALYFRLRLGIATTAGSTNIVAVGIQQPLPKLVQSVNITGSSLGNLATTNIPSPANYAGFAAYHTLISAASTNATLVKNSNGTLGTLLLSNNTASLKWFRIFNKASAPTVGTDTPVINIPIQPNTTLDVSGGFAGLRLSTGIAYAITGGSASAAVTDSTAVAAGDVTVNMTYV